MSLEVDVPVVDLPRGLQNLYTTPACPHGYRNPIQVVQVQPQMSQRQCLWRDAHEHYWLIRDTLTLDLEEPSMSTSASPLRINHLFPVDSNPIAGWAAVALADLRTFQTVGLLQQKACLSCTLTYADELMVNGSRESQAVFIFSAGEV